MKCSICDGIPAHEKYTAGSDVSILQRMKREQICFSCSFWKEQINQPYGVVIADGKHYRIGDGRGQFRGFGGTDWTIHYRDGRTRTTSDLWYQGKIPQRFRDQLPDNATLEQTDAG